MSKIKYQTLVSKIKKSDSKKRKSNTRVKNKK